MRKMALDPEVTEYLRREVRQAVIERFDSRFNDQALGWAKGQLESVPSAEGSRCELGRAWTSGVRTVLSDRTSIQLIMDGIKAEERRIMRGQGETQVEANGQVGVATGPIDNGSAVVGLDGPTMPRPFPVTIRVEYHSDYRLNDEQMAVLSAIERDFNRAAQLHQSERTMTADPTMGGG